MAGSWRWCHTCQPANSAACANKARTQSCRRRPASCSVLANCRLYLLLSEVVSCQPLAAGGLGTSLAGRCLCRPHRQPDVLGRRCAKACALNVVFAADTMKGSTPAWPGGIHREGGCTVAFWLCACMLRRPTQPFLSCPPCLVPLLMGEHRLIGAAERLPQRKWIWYRCQITLSCMQRSVKSPFLGVWSATLL